MQYLKNHFPIIKRYTDLRKYETQLNQVIEKFFKKFFEKFEILSLYRVKNAFWALVNTEKVFNPLDWYDAFAIFIVRLCFTQIQLSECKIIEETHEIFTEWFLYLARRIIPKEEMLSSNFLNKLYSGDLIPIPDFEAAWSLLEENVDLVKEHQLSDILYDESIPIVERLRTFQVFYIGFYEFFKRKCIYIENYLYKCENRDTPLHTIRDIFQIHNNNERTPSNLPRDALRVLIHVRNSCAHRNMTVLRDGKVRVRDYNNNGELTYENIRTVIQLWDYYYGLLVLDKGFDAIALAIMLKRRIDQLYMLYGKLLQCPDCNSINHYCILPNTNLIICKNCKIPFNPNNI